MKRAKFIYFIKNNQLLLSLVLFSLILELYGSGLRQMGYENENVTGVGSSIALACLELREGVYPWNMQVQDKTEIYDEAMWEDYVWTPSENLGEEIISMDAEGTVDSSTGEGIDSVEDSFTVENSDVSTENDFWSNAFPVEGDSNSANASDALVVGEETEVQENLPLDEWGQAFQTVELSYFDDALFIGDSRMVGVAEYAGMKNATFYARTGMSIYNLMDGKIETDSTVGSVREGLEQNQFGKIYIMVGINELGIGNLGYFMLHYEEVVKEIHEMQPDAIIYLQGIMHVASGRDHSDAYVNNANINERNEAISSLANHRNIFYIDVNPVYDDENGNLNSDYTGDQVHLYATKYDLWREFYLEHGAVIP